MPSPDAFEFTSQAPRLRLRLRKVVLLLLAACSVSARCSSDSAPRQTGMVDSVVPVDSAVHDSTTDAISIATTPEGATLRPGFRSSAAPAETMGRFVDSIRVGDTTWFKRGVILRVVDSQWLRRPVIPLGIPFGVFHLPTDSLNKGLGYSALVLTVTASTLKTDLDRIRARGGKVVLNVGRLKLRDGVDTGLSVAAATAELRRWDSSAVAQRINDSTIIAIQVGDDIGGDDWGTASLPVRLARWDTIMGEVHKRWRQAATTIRARPATLPNGTAQLESRQWKSLTTAWSQYNGPVRDGPVEQWIRGQVAGAKAMKVGLILGVNVLDGGCGPTRWCQSDAPGVPIFGTYPDTTINRWQVSPAEFAVYHARMIAEPYTCAVLDWQWSPIYTRNLPPLQLQRIRAFHSQPAVQSAAKALGVAARTSLYTSCRR